MNRLGEVELASAAAREFEQLPRPYRGRLLMELTREAHRLWWPGLLTVWTPSAVAAGEIMAPGGPLLVYAILAPRAALRLVTGRPRGL
jgi:hypothetical protein